MLNKDLWVRLDSLTEQLSIKWTWVEGHQEVEGNLQADTLAKKGIVSDKFMWQDTASKLSKNENDDCGFDADISLPMPNLTEDQDGVKFTCNKCLTDCVEGENCIQCQDCKTWIHYICSRLPPYQLFLYESTQRRYTCESCTEVDEEFITEYKKQVANTDERNNVSKKSTASTQTDAAHDVTPRVVNYESVSCQTEPLSHTDNKTIYMLESKLCQTEEQCVSIVTERVPDSSQKGRQLESTIINHESIASQTEEQFYDFELFKTSTITTLQESFVTAFDKINDSIRTMRINRREEDEMKQHITSLTKENERLKEAKKIETHNMPKDKVTCQTCSETAVKLEKMNNMLATEREKSQLSLHNITVVKENQIAKLEADACLLKHQLVLAGKKNQTYEQEMSSLEKRIDAKNDIITKLETQKSDMVTKITNLEDEIMSWKLQT